MFTPIEHDLHVARRQTDELFQVVHDDSFYERPIPERHRIVFYLGHLEAFDWNMICASLFHMKSMRKTFDDLFAFGIDPTNGNLPQDKARDWPQRAEIDEYNSDVREAVDRCLDRAGEDHRFRLVIEHRLMHAETL